jgi:SOS-response transcriptional repressor LexA
MAMNESNRMTFHKLQDRLRKRLLAHVAAGQITGMRLAEMAGFQQAHMSNFLNRKRALSLDAMDRVLAALRWTVFDLLDDAELQPLSSRLPAADDDYDNVPLVAEEALAEPTIVAQQVREVLKFKRSFLRRLRPEATADRAQWQRFALVKADSREGMGMYPRMLPGATLLIDRHYNSFKPYRRNERNMYAVRFDGNWTIKYVEQAGRSLVLRPQNETYPISVVQVSDSETPEEYILGRVCHVGIET